MESSTGPGLSGAGGGSVGSVGSVPPLMVARLGCGAVWRHLGAVVGGTALMK